MSSPVVAVLSSTLPAGPGAADPTALCAAFRERGVDARLIDTAVLADLRPGAPYHVVALPNAPSFPLGHLAGLRAFLRAGGHLIALGGPAFSRLFVPEGNGWREQSTFGDSLVPPLTDLAWQPSDPARCSREECRRGDALVPGLRMYVSAAEVDSFPGEGVEPGAEWHCKTGAFAPGATYVLTAWMRCEGVGGRHFAHFHWTYLRVEQSDAAGEVLHSALLDFEHPYLTGSEPWREMAYRFVPDARAVRLTARVGIKPGAFGALWVTDVALRREEWATTAVGPVCDGLHVLPHQIGCFDPSFRLEHVHRVATSPRQGIVQGKSDAALSVSGYAASASTGEEPDLGPTHVGHPRTVRRVTPLLEALDEHGRPRGPVFSLVHNTAGFYEGSIWACTAVEEPDLTGALPGFYDLLAEVARHMADGLHIRSAAPAVACYREGEDVAVEVELGRGDRGAGAGGGARIGAGDSAAGILRVACRIVGRDGNESWSGVRDAAFGAGSDTVRTTIRCGTIALPSDLYSLSVSLRREGREIDRVDSGFVVWKPDIQGAGRTVTFQDNSFRLDGRPAFLCGTKGGVFWLDDHPSEDPLAWDRECGFLRDCGLCVYGMVGLSQWITLGMEADARERMLRRLDARVQLCHVHGIVPFIDLQFHPVPGSDREAEIAYASAIAERYRSFRTLFFYVTGDITLPLVDVPEMRDAFRGWLRARYGSDSALADAWSDPAARIDDARIDPMKAYWQRRPWRDVRAADLHAFRNEYLRAWLGVQAAGLRKVAAGPGTRLITAEFWSDQQLDQWNASTGLDFSAMGIGLGQRLYMHRYDAPMLCLADMRLAGQSFTIGEFGTQVHPGFDHVGYSWSTAAGKIDRFAMVVHHAFGLGGSMIAAWDAADLDYYIFPWGLLSADRRVPKEFCAAYRNYSLFFRRLVPAPAAPDVLLVLPDENRRSGNFHVVSEALFSAARLLLQCRVDFAVINDGALGRIATTPRALVYPIPYCPSDEVVGHVRRLAADGTHVYLSGDFSLDPLRRRTRAGRLESLAGVRFSRELRPGISRAGDRTRVLREDGGRRQSYAGLPCIEAAQAGAAVTWRTAEGMPVGFRNAVGKGSVSFHADPIELLCFPEDTAGNRERRAVYAEFLDHARVERHGVDADEDVESFVRPLEDGGEAVVLYCNRPASGEAAAVSLRCRGSLISFSIGSCRGGTIVVDGAGAVVAWEGRGTLRVNDRSWLDAAGDVLVYSADGAALSLAACLVVLPLGEGSLRWTPDRPARVLSAACGELEAGRWRTLREPAVRVDRGGAWLAWTASDARSIILLGTEKSIEAATDLVRADLLR